MISTLNRYFVPVYISNADYRPGGSATAEERQELQRIFREGLAKKLSVGTVHAYVLAPDGHLVDSRHVVKVSRAEGMLELLEGAVHTLGTPAGEPVVKPTPQSTAKAKPGELLLHLTARYLRKQGDRLMPIVPAEGSAGDWTSLPGEDWIHLDREKTEKLVASGDLKPGASWDVEQPVAQALLRYFYPPTENNNVEHDSFEEAALHASVEAVENGTARVRLTGSFRFQHNFYYRPDGKVAQGTVVGYLKCQAGGDHPIHSLELVTENAGYGDPKSAGSPFGVELHTESAH